jgi:phospholipid/cholesterol/gamma-HCH transport system permease protein
VLQKLTDLLGAQGRAMRVSVTNSGYAVRVLGASLARVVPDLRHRRGFLRDQLMVCGLTPLPVVCVVGMFTGMILALQVGVELAQYGQAEQLSSIIGVILFREMGPVMTGMILTASVGSAMAAEIGTMSVSEEIDGLECLSIDINSFLAMPRIVALTIMAPILVFVGCVLGIMGGALVSLTQLSVPLDVYYRNVRESLTADPGFGGFPEEIYTGLIKSAVFGMLIATISCAAGMQAHGGALGVGRAVRSAVVRSFLMIIVFGYFISWLFFR